MIVIAVIALQCCVHNNKIIIMTCTIVRCMTLDRHDVDLFTQFTTSMCSSQIYIVCFPIQAFPPHKGYKAEFRYTINRSVEILLYPTTHTFSYTFY